MCSRHGHRYVLGKSPVGSLNIRPVLSRPFDFSELGARERSLPFGSSRAKQVSSKGGPTDEGSKLRTPSVATLKSGALFRWGLVPSLEPIAAVDE